MNGNLTRVYLDAFIESMAKISPSEPIWKILEVGTTIRLLSESLHTDKQRAKLEQDLNMADNGLVTAEDVPKGFDIPVPAQLLEILQMDKNGKMSAVPRDKLFNTCGFFFVDDFAEEEVVQGEDDDAKYRMLVFDEDDDGKVAEIREIGETEIHNYVTDFLVRTVPELATKSDTELASEYCLEAVSDARPLSTYLYHVILYHVVDARLFQTAVHNELSGTGRTALQLAAKQGCIETLKALLHTGADADATIGMRRVNGRVMDTGDTVLHLTSNLDVVKCLTAGGANIDAKNDDGITPLYEYCRMSIMAKCLKIADFLISAGADVNACPAQTTKTSLHEVIQGAIDASNPAYFRISNPDTEAYLTTIKRLITAGANVNAKSEGGAGYQTPLDLAFKHDLNLLEFKHRIPKNYFLRLKIVRVLLSAGAKISIPRNETYSVFSSRDSVLISAEESKDLSVTKVLADVKAVRNAIFVPLNF